MITLAMIDTVCVCSVIEKVQLQISVILASQRRDVSVKKKEK
jgi:hypothetical protein